MEQIISTLYQVNEQYHNVKEKMVWLVVTGYLAFWAGYMKWILADHWSKNAWDQYACYLIIFLAFITIFAAYFAAYQNFMKAKTARAAKKYHDAIRKLDTELSYNNLIDMTKINMCFFQGNCSVEGRPGKWLVGLTLALGVLGCAIIVAVPHSDVSLP